MGNNQGSCLNQQSLNNCRDRCGGTPGCLGFSFNGNSGGCCLKDSLGGSYVFDNDAVSLVVNPNNPSHLHPIVGVVFPGNNLVAKDGWTYDQCIQLCLQTSGCGMVLFLRLSSLTESSTQPCVLKSVNQLNWKFQDGWSTYLLPKTALGGAVWTRSGANSMIHCLPCPEGISLF